MFKIVRQMTLSDSAERRMVDELIIFADHCLTFKCK